MNLFAITRRNLRQRLLSTSLTTISIMLGTALLASLLLLRAELDRGFKTNIGGYKVVVGPAGTSPLQLVTNTVFNAGQPPGLIPLSVYRTLKDGKIRRGRMKYTIPQSRSDFYSRYNFPIVGTTDAMFHKFETAKDQNPAFSEGEPWSFNDDDLFAYADAYAEGKNREAAGNFFENPIPPLQEQWRGAVVGARVARKLGLQIGDSIVPQHGLHGDPGTHEHPESAVDIVGILAPTNSPIDRVIYVPVAVVWSTPGHDAVMLEPATAEAPYTADGMQITAVIGRPLDHMGDRILKNAFEKEASAQVATPATEIPELLKTVGDVNLFLTLIAFLVLLVAAVSVLVALYNTMSERRREIAIIRSLGARRGQILRIIVQEALFISLLGAVLGILVCHVGMALAAPLVEEYAGVFIDWTSFSWTELWIIVGVGVLGVVAGLLPALKGSMTEVAEHLTPAS